MVKITVSSPHLCMRIEWWGRWEWNALLWRIKSWGTRSGLMLFLGSLSDLMEESVTLAVSLTSSVSKTITEAVINHNDCLQRELCSLLSNAHCAFSTQRTRSVMSEVPYGSSIKAFFFLVLPQVLLSIGSLCWNYFFNITQQALRSQHELISELGIYPCSYQKKSFTFSARMYVFCLGERQGRKANRIW